MKVDNFKGDQTETSAKRKSLLATPLDDKPVLVGRKASLKQGTNVFGGSAQYCIKTYETCSTSS